MKLSCCIWALNEGTGPFRKWRRYTGQRVGVSENLRRLSRLGFRSVDICPSMLRSPTTQSLLESLKLEVSCISASHEAPKNSTFDSEDSLRVDPIVDHAKCAIAHAADLGAAYSYVVPGPIVDRKTLIRYADRYAELAEWGQNLGVKIGVEHFPGTALPTVKGTLEFIREIGHPNLYLLFDLGHAQISNEDPADVLPLAADRLAYVHLDDNDGKGDLHYALTDGIQTEESLKQFFHILEDIGYKGPLSLEMMPTLPDPLGAIRRSKQLVEQFVDIS